MSRALLVTSMTACLSLGACGDDQVMATVTTPSITTVNLTKSGGDTTTGDDTTTTGDDTTTGTSGQASGDSTTGTSTTTTGGDTSTGGDTTTTGADESTGTTVVDPVEACLEMTELGDECGECSCIECLEELNACRADEGCTEIRTCADESGCQGLNCIGPCSSVINLYGGPFGPSMNLNLALENCVGSECPGLCF